jgi:disulfide bond formation protein DsbB
VSARHIWIQHQPEGSVPACGASLDYLLEVFPLTDVIRKVLAGSGECARVTWTFLGLSMPGWVLIAALALGAFGGWVNFPLRSRQQIAQQ